MSVQPQMLRDLLEKGDHEAFLELISVRLPGRAGGVTRKNYLSSLRVYLRWAREEGRSVLHAGAGDVQAYHQHLLLRATPATLHNHFTRIRTLYDLLGDLGLYTAVNPWTGVKLTSNRAEEHRDLYTDEELQRLLAHGDALERLLVYLGGRLGLTGPEVVRLHWEHLDTMQGYVLVRGRQLQTDTEVDGALRTYGAQVGHTDLFQAYGPVFAFQTDHQLRRALYVLCQRANVPYRAWRALRNSAGLRILRQTGDPAQVAERLGLSTLKAVEVWQKLTPSGQA